MKAQLITLFGALIAGIASAAYSPSIATKAVYYSGASYCSASTLQSWSCGPACQKTGGVSNVTPIINSVRGTQCFVGYNAADNQIIVSFRGSRNIANWMSNIDYIQVPYKNVAGALVH